MKVTFVVELHMKTQTKARVNNTVTKRSIKNFSRAGWNAALEGIAWNELDDITDLNEKADEFSNLMNKALDLKIGVARWQYEKSYRIFSNTPQLYNNDLT